MSNLRGGNNNIPFSARQPTSVIPLKSPCFSVYHYNQPCSSGYQSRTSAGLLGGKRKSTSESMFHPCTKQQITEARIASSMQRLSLENSYENSANVPSTSDRTQDEGFFEDINDLNYNNEDDIDSSNTDQTRLPSFKLTADVKDGLDEMMNGILPKQIYKSMNQSCLALVPYVPPTDVLLMPSSTMQSEEKSSKKIHGSSHLPSEDEMKCEDSEEEESMLY